MLNFPDMSGELKRLILFLHTHQVRVYEGNMALKRKFNTFLPVGKKWRLQAPPPSHGKQQNIRTMHWLPIKKCTHSLKSLFYPPVPL
jgi:hypothetical protein